MMNKELIDSIMEMIKSGMLTAKIQAEYGVENL